MAVIAATSDLSTELALVVVLLGGVLAVALYLLPFIIGEARGVPHLHRLLAINLLLGWTLIGWLAVLAMASRTKGAPAVATPRGLVPASSNLNRGTTRSWDPMV